jgi:hypothetical protein
LGLFAVFLVHVDRVLVPVLEGNREGAALSRNRAAPHTIS